MQYPAIRNLQYTIASGYSLLRLVRQGKDIDGKDLLREGAILGASLAAIYYQDKIIEVAVSRGLVQGVTRTLVGVQLAYIAGAVASTYIDPDEGFENYNEFIDMVFEEPSEAVRVTGQNLLLVSQYAILEAASAYKDIDMREIDHKLQQFFGGINLRLA